jgi:hypothetical protein
MSIPTAEMIHAFRDSKREKGTLGGRAARGGRGRGPRSQRGSRAGPRAGPGACHGFCHATLPPLWDGVVLRSEAEAAQVLLGRVPLRLAFEKAFGDLGARAGEGVRRVRGGLHRHEEPREDLLRAVPHEAQAPKATLGEADGNPGRTLETRLRALRSAYSGLSDGAADKNGQKTPRPRSGLDRSNLTRSGSSVT